MSESAKYLAETEKQIIQVSIENVQIPKERQRTTELVFDQLAASIKEHGLLHPIIIDKDFTLIAGWRRYVSCRSLGWKEIPAICIGSLPPLQRREIELVENIRRVQLSWTDEVKAKREVHLLRQELYGESSHSKHVEGWSLQDTADFLEDSKSGIARDIELAKALELFPSLAKEKNKATALVRYRKLIAEALEKELLKRTEKTSMAEIIQGDCLAVLPKTEKANLCIFDPPWGLRLDKAPEWKNRELVVFFDDSAATAQEQIPQMLHAIYDALKDESIIFSFYMTEWYTRIKQWHIDAGFNVIPLPLIWVKKSPTHAFHGYTPMHQYESILLAMKGKRKLSMPISDILQFDSTARGEKIHPNEKPLELIEFLIKAGSTGGDLVLDPCAGSGVVLEAAWETGRRAVIIEKDEDQSRKINQRAKRLLEKGNGDNARNER